MNLKIDFFTDRFSTLFSVRQISIKNGHKRSAPFSIRNLKILVMKNRDLLIWQYSIFDSIFIIATKFKCWIDIFFWQCIYIFDGSFFFRQSFKNLGNL